MASMVKFRKDEDEITPVNARNAYGFPGSAMREMARTRSIVNPEYTGTLTNALPQPSNQTGDEYFNDRPAVAPGAAWRAIGSVASGVGGALTRPSAYRVENGVEYDAAGNPVNQPAQVSSLQAVPRLGLGVSPTLLPDQEVSMALNQGIRGGQQVLGGSRIITRPEQTTLLTNRQVEDIGEGDNFVQLEGGLRQAVTPSSERSLFVQGSEGQPVLRNAPERGFLNLDTFRAQNAYKEPTLADLMSKAAQERKAAPAAFTTAEDVLAEQGNTGTPSAITFRRAAAIANQRNAQTAAAENIATRDRKLATEEAYKASIAASQATTAQATAARALKELQKPPAESKFEWSTGGVDFEGNPIKPSFSVGKTKIDLDPAEAEVIDKTARQNFANWRAVNPDVTDPVELEKEMKKFLQRATFDNYGQMIEAQTPED
jgi:hypothetical protein